MIALVLAEAAGAAGLSPVTQAVTSAVLFVGTTAAVYLGWRPLRGLVLRQERQFESVLRGALLLDVSPRAVTVLTALAMLCMGSIGLVATSNVLGAVAAGAVGALLPWAVLKTLRRRRLVRLETQLVGGVVTLSSGVRAGLNLVQAMELVARDGPVPICQEFAHLLREYEYGTSLEEAMNNAATRIGSPDYRLLFTALATHRERGGDLGVTLDRIAESIREIQRLEKRVQALTAQGRATARWLGAMPAVIGGIYYLIDAAAVGSLFHENMGNLVLAAVIVLNILGFLWIRKIVAIDI